MADQYAIVNPEDDFLTLDHLQCSPEMAETENDVTSCPTDTASHAKFMKNGVDQGYIKRI